MHTFSELDYNSNYRNMWVHFFFDSDFIRCFICLTPKLKACQISVYPIYYYYYICNAVVVHCHKSLKKYLLRPFYKRKRADEFLFSTQYKNIFSTENLTWKKSWFVYYFIIFTREKRPPNKISSQNFSVEKSFSYSADI